MHNRLGVMMWVGLHAPVVPPICEDIGVIRAWFGGRWVYELVLLAMRPLLVSNVVDGFIENGSSL
jgi:hypothetical protein